MRQKKNTDEILNFWHDIDINLKLAISMIDIFLFYMSDGIEIITFFFHWKEIGCK